MAKHSKYDKLQIKTLKKHFPCLQMVSSACCEVPGPWAVRKQMLAIVFMTISLKHERLHSQHPNPQSFFVTALKS